ncbi:MAG: hypothetical protein ACREJ6_15950 [Candidatus Methylomirabilis sp.]
MAHNTNVVYVRGLSAEERRMLSAKAANTRLRTVNAYMLAMIREDLGLADVATRLGRRGDRIWNIPGQGLTRLGRDSSDLRGGRDTRHRGSPRSWTREIAETLEIPGPAGAPAAEGSEA